MQQDNKEKSQVSAFIYEDEPSFEPRDFISHDLDLMVLLMLIEAASEDRSILNFIHLYKGSFWKNGSYPDDAQNTDELFSREDSVFDHIHFMIEDLRMGNLIAAGIDDMDVLLEDMINKVAEGGLINEQEKMEEYKYAFEQVFFLRENASKVREDLLEEAMKNNEELLSSYFSDRYANVFFTKTSNFFEKLQLPIIEAPDRILMEFRFDKNGVTKVNKLIKAFIEDFSDDDKKEDGDVYFTKQIEAFYGYVSKLNVIGNSINMPFSILNERDFEPIKILKYLQIHNRIDIRWLDEGSWKVKFHTMPITTESLVGNVAQAVKLPIKQKLKLNLSFSSKTGILRFTDTEGDVVEVKITGQVQKEVLRVVFLNPQNAFDEWSLYDISDIIIGEEVNDVAVKNAIYQLNRKVALNLPKVKKLFELNIHSAQLNAKYVQKD